MKLPWRSRKPKYLTVEDAIKTGVIDPEALRRPYIPRRAVTEDPDGTVFPSWKVWRIDKTEDYLGIPPERKTVRRANVPSGMREPIIDLGAGVTDVEYRAARGLLLDKGIAKGPEE